MPLAKVIEARVVLMGALEEPEKRPGEVFDQTPEAREGSTAHLQGDINHAELVLIDMFTHQDAPHLAAAGTFQGRREACGDFIR